VASFKDEICPELLTKGANVDLQTLNDGCNALMMASQEGHLEICKAYHE